MREIPLGESTGGGHERADRSCNPPREPASDQSRRQCDDQHRDGGTQGELTERGERLEATGGDERVPRQRAGTLVRDEPLAAGGISHVQDAAGRLKIQTPQCTATVSSRPGLTAPAAGEERAVGVHDGHGAIRLRRVQAQGRMERLERQCELQQPDDLTGLVVNRMMDEDDSGWLTRARRERHTLRDVGLATLQDQACPLGLGAGDPLAAILGLGRCPDEQVGVHRRDVDQVRIRPQQLLEHLVRFVDAALADCRRVGQHVERLTPRLDQRIDVGRPKSGRFHGGAPDRCPPGAHALHGEERHQRQERHGDPECEDEQPPADRCTVGQEPPCSPTPSLEPCARLQRFHRFCCARSIFAARRPLLTGYPSQVSRDGCPCWRRASRGTIKAASPSTASGRPVR